MTWIINNYLEFLKWLVLGVLVFATFALVCWAFASIVALVVCKYDEWLSKLSHEIKSADQELKDLRENVDSMKEAER